MISAEQNKLAMENLIAKANAKTGESDTDLTGAVDRLVAGFGQGGGGLTMAHFDIKPKFERTEG